MESFIAASIRACHEVDLLIKEGSVSLFTLHGHGYGGDVSNGVDLKAEAILFSHLSSYGSVFSEESGWMSPESGVSIFLDPIDGSDNFVSRLPYYGISIARVTEGETTEAVVCNLANGDIFVRTREEYYITSLQNPSIKHPILTNLSAKVGLFEKGAEHPDLIRMLMSQKLKFRSPGALALSLAYAPYEQIRLIVEKEYF